MPANHAQFQMRSSSRVSQSLFQNPNMKEVVA